MSRMESINQTPTDYINISPPFNQNDFILKIKSGFETSDVSGQKKVDKANLNNA